jgi:hypothetical protein
VSLVPRFLKVDCGERESSDDYLEDDSHSAT